MINYQFEKFRQHIGHKIECVCYGLGNDVQNVSIECIDCGCVVIDANKDGEDDEND
jgi:hypothetical protein